MANEGTNTGLVVVIIVLVVALLITVFYFTRGGGGGDAQDAEMELEVNTSGDSAEAGAIMAEPSLATRVPRGLRFTA